MANKDGKFSRLDNILGWIAVPVAVPLIYATIVGANAYSRIVQDEEAQREERYAPLVEFGKPKPLKKYSRPTTFTNFLSRLACWYDG